jgi:hypothetical protein
MIDVSNLRFALCNFFVLLVEDARAANDRQRQAAVSDSLGCASIAMKLACLREGSSHPSLARRVARPFITKAIGRHLTCLLMSVAISISATSASALEVVHPSPESAEDTRFEYYWQLLARALAITESDFGPSALHPAASAMTEPRAIEELMNGSGKITVLVHGNVADYEKQLLPIYFPLDKGLLGYRVFLIRSETQARMNSVKGLRDLQQHSFGQGSNWADATILRKAGLRVVEGTSYEGLFSMLSAGRFELFSRGVVEIGDELARHKSAHPELTIEQRLLLHYPLTRYFYVRRSPEGEALARRISTGLERMLSDGSFDKMFQTFKAPVEDQIGLRNRLLIEIDNPLQTPQTPLYRPELWYDPRRDN